jgi:DNA mismatch repair protein MutS
VIERAKLVLAKLEQEDRTAPKGFEDLPLFSVTPQAHPETPQPAEDPVAAALAAINPDDLSPREAMEALYVLKAKLADTRKS